MLPDAGRRQRIHHGVPLITRDAETYRGIDAHFELLDLHGYSPCPWPTLPADLSPALADRDLSTHPKEKYKKLQ